MNKNVIFKFILFILKHPVNPVIYMDVMYAGFAGAKTCQGFLEKATHSYFTH